MNQNASIAERIVRFGEQPRDNEILDRTIIRSRADNNITIDQRPLGAVFDEVFRIPDYQRGYQWEEDQWEELWNQIDAFANVDVTDPNRITDVFFGSMFYSERNAEDVNLGDRVDGDVFDVIDGQQRITTVSILFKILADELSDCLSESSPDFIRQYSEHVGILNNQIYRNGNPADGPALIREKGGAGGLESQETDDLTLFEALMGNNEKKINHLLKREEKNNNRKYGVIRISEYLDKLRLDEDEYLEALIGVDDPHSCPNIPSSRVSAIESANSVSDLDASDRSYFIEQNRVEFSDSETTLTNAYSYFYERVHGNLLDGEETENRYRLITNTYNYILNCFQIGYFEVRDNDPQLLMRIFELLNDQGVDLKKKDLIRTRISNKLRAEEDYEEYKQKWESVVDRFGDESEVIISFLETYFAATEDNIHTRGDVSNRLLEAFTLEENGSSKKIESRISTIDDAKQFLDELELYSKLYHQINHPRDEGFDFSGEHNRLEEQCNRILTRLRDHGTDIWEPLVLGYYYKVHSGQHSDIGDIQSLLYTVESFVIRFSVGGSANDRDSTYERGVEEFSSSGEIGRHIEVAMIERAIEKTESNKIFGTDLLENLMRTDWQAKRCKAILRKVVSKDLGSELDDRMLEKELKPNNDHIHIEHVLPKNPLQQHGDRYGWIESFYTADGTDGIVDESFSKIIEHHIEQEMDEELGNINNRFKSVLGNHILLLSSANTRISNSRYGEKLAGYAATEDFEELITSRKIIENDKNPNDWGKLANYGRYKRYLSDPDIDLEQLDLPTESDKKEWIESELESINPTVEDYNSNWNMSRVQENSEFLLGVVSEALKFSTWIESEWFGGVNYDGSEFESADITEIVEADLERRQKYVEGNQRRNI